MLISINLTLDYTIRSIGRGLGGSKPRQGFYPELARKGEIRVVDEGALLAKNLAPGSYLA